MSLFRPLNRFTLTLLLLAISAPCFAASAIGYVVDPEGKPVAGATVTIFDFSRSEIPTTLITDPIGSFTADIGSYPDQDTRWCMVDAKGFAPIGGYLSTGRDNRFQIALPARITGTVVDANKQPVSGATVSALRAGDPLSRTWSDLSVGTLKDRYTTHSDSQGRYTLSDLPQNAVITLLLHDTRFTDQVVKTTKGSLTAPPIIALPGVPITGKVLHDDGTPAGGLEVEVFDLHTGSQEKTAADGSYKIIGLAPGVYTVIAKPQASAYAPPSDWVAPPGVKITTTTEKPALVPDIVLTHGAIATGVIVDAASKQPVPNVFIHIETQPTAGQEPPSVRAITDARGRYTLHVWPGAHTFYISQAPEDYASDPSKSLSSFTVADGQTYTLDPISIQRIPTIAGIAVDDGGNPIPDLTLRTQQAQVGWGRPNLPEETTDQDGTFTLHQLVPGSYALDAGDDWTVVSPATITAPFSGLLKVVLKKRAMTTLSGSVVDSSGTPISGVDIAFTMDHVHPNGDRDEHGVDAISGDDGKFTVPDVPLDSGMVHFSTSTRDGYILQDGGEITKSGDNLTIAPIVMDRLNGVITGIVRNGNGVPVAAAWVVCPEAGKGALPIQTDAAGRFKLTGLVVGPVDLYAAKGRTFGHRIALPAVTPTKTSVVLDPMPPQPPAVDLQRGTEILQSLQPGQDWLRLQCADALAAYDPDAGLRFLQGYGDNVGIGVVRDLIDARSVMNPLAAAKWGIPRIEQAADGGYKSGAAAYLGLAIAPTDASDASMLYQIALKNIRFDNIDDQSIDNAMHLTAFAYALGRPESADFYRKTVAAMREIIKNAKPDQDNDDEADYLPQNMAQIVALGNPTLAMQILDTLPQEERDYDSEQLISELVERNPAGALAVFHSLDKDEETPFGYGPYNEALCMVLPILFKTDPRSALAAADSDDQAPRALAIVAALLPLAQAAPLYRKAETKFVDDGADAYMAAWIAAQAWNRDKTLGEQLYKEAYDKVIATPTTDRWSSYAEFAYYYARFDPGFSRILLEKQFAQDQRDPSPYGGDAGGLVEDAAAMAAVDVDRARAMAFSIKDPNASFRAGL